MKSIQANSSVKKVRTSVKNRQNWKNDINSNKGKNSIVITSYLAKYDNNCWKCEKLIKKGIDYITLDRKKKVWIHKDCYLEER